MHVAKQHYIPKQRGDSGDLFLQKDTYLVQTELTFRIRALAYHLESNIRLGRFVQVDKPHISLVAYAHQALVLDDAAQPCAEGPFPPVLFEPLEGFPEGVLNLILSIAAIADHQACPLQTRVAVPLDQFAESPFVPFPGAFDQGFVSRNAIDIDIGIGLSGGTFRRCSSSSSSGEQGVGGRGRYRFLHWEVLI
jgi:hypothetical protein